jgi:hypothetical protein
LFSTNFIFQPSRLVAPVSGHRRQERRTTGENIGGLELHRAPIEHDLVFQVFLIQQHPPGQRKFDERGELRCMSSKTGVLPSPGPDAELGSLIAPRCNDCMTR